MVPGILGAECGLGLGSVTNRSAPGWRSLCGERAESVDELRLDRELVRACGADGFQRAEEQRAFGAADRHEIAWSGSSSAQADDGGERVQRDFLSRRARARGESSWQSE